MKKIYDGDNLKLLGEFPEEKTEEYIEIYKSYGKWQDVSVDINGDIILFENE